MENDIPRRIPDGGTEGAPADDTAGGPTSDEARDALAALNTDATQLASRLVTPWWYHLILGVIVAAAIGAQALPKVSSVSVIAMVVIWIPFLMRAYTSRYRISMTAPAGPRSLRVLLLLLAVLALLMGSGVLMTLNSVPQWWVLVRAVLGFFATVGLGRRYDAVLRSEVSATSAPSVQR